MKRITRIFVLMTMTLLLVFADAHMAYAQRDLVSSIEFRPGSDVLYDRYGNNVNELAEAKQLLSHYEDVIMTGNGHVRLVAMIGGDKKNDPVAINLAAIRAAVVRNYLKQNFRMFTNWSFTFCLDDTRGYDDEIEVQYVPYAIPADVSSEIYYTDNKNDVLAVKRALSKYGTLPYVSDGPAFVHDTVVRARFDMINVIATNPVDVNPQDGEANSEKLLIAIHYRWDKDNLDSLYLSNPENLQLLDSILNSGNSKYIDTLTIVAYASPEGQPDHNKRLSQSRAQTIRNYILKNYKAIAPERIVTEARGENWKGLRNFALNDSDLPSRNEVINIIDSSLPSRQKQSMITQLDGGTTYYRYILPNYYRYLRNGASVLVTYSPNMPKIYTPVILSEIRPWFVPILESGLAAYFVPDPEPIVKYPIALRTNLLFDAIGALNIGIEVPIGNHFSVIADFAYSYWRSSTNLSALQTLQGGVEGRYWFGVDGKKKQKKPEWAKPLRGWNVGAYAMYCSRYDVQWVNGYQGEGYWSAGLTAGYATPIARNLALEFSLAAGYFQTPEYRHYHKPEFDADGKHHLMWQETGSYGTFTLTKARVSLVWLIRSEKKGGQK